MATWKWWFSFSVHSLFFVIVNLEEWFLMSRHRKIKKNRVLATSVAVIATVPDWTTTAVRAMRDENVVNASSDTPETRRRNVLRDDRQDRPFPRINRDGRRSLVVPLAATYYLRATATRHTPTIQSEHSWRTWCNDARGPCLSKSDDNRKRVSPLCPSHRRRPRGRYPVCSDGNKSRAVGDAPGKRGPRGKSVLGPRLKPRTRMSRDATL